MLSVHIGEGLGVSGVSRLELALVPLRKARFQVLALLGVVVAKTRCAYRHTEEGCSPTCAFTDKGLDALDPHEYVVKTQTLQVAGGGTVEVLYFVKHD